MDGRIALAPGTVLKLAGGTGDVPYTITREIGRGGSCLVYDASYTDNLGNYKLVRIKECYPCVMRIMRKESGELQPEAGDAQAFKEAKERLIAAYQKNHELFMISELTNTVANTSEIYEANGTIYLVSVYMNGKTFGDFQGETLHDCVALIRSTARVLKRIHDAGYLYLDLKPDNILTLEGSLDLVQLFDFDSMISLEDLQNAVQTGDPGRLRTSYTRGYASLEQQTGKLHQLGRHSDLYSLGAVLFHALWHRTPSAFDCEPDAKYDFSCMTYGDRTYQDRLFRALTRFFHRTLASYPADRYPNAEEAIAQLNEILSLADESKPWVYSSPVGRSTAFFGRQREMDALCDLLEQADHGTGSVYGMGGIGKSTLVRRYAADHSDDWDAILWLYDQGNLAGAFADDTLVRINTVHRLKEESTEEYLQRKTRALSSIANEQRILLVIDNFEPDHLEELELFRRIGLTILLISRERLPEGMCPAMQVKELNEEDLACLFRHYSHCDLREKQEQEAFRKIISRINGHTLLTELIARQIAKSYLDIGTAESMVTGIGLADLPDEKIDYIRDQSVWRGTLLSILDRLVEINRLREQDRVCMKMLSLFHAPGIEAGLFKELTGLTSLDFINELEASGWVMTDSRNLYLHPMMQEYIRTWPWTHAMEGSAERMMCSLYEMIHPAGTRHDLSRQFPEDYDRLRRLHTVAQQMIDHTDRTTEASQRLKLRCLMDSPVDQDASVLAQMLELLDDPRYLDESSILRLYETAAYYRARLYNPDDAVAILKEMKRYLKKHPSDYYRSAYHRAMSVILHNASRNLERILKHEDKAIAAVRVSAHPEAKKQLAACLMNKARTLMSEGIRQGEVQKLILEAAPIVSGFTEPLDYERYQYSCNAAMFFAMEGDTDSAQAMLDAADAIAYASPDSDLSVAEHLIEEVAPIRLEMGQFAQAAEAVTDAIHLCEKHPEAIRYRETIFDAYLFLGRIYVMDEAYVRAEDAFNEAEKRVQDSPYEWKLPLCPKDVREKAEQIRSQMPDIGTDPETKKNTAVQQITIRGRTITIPMDYQRVDSRSGDPDNSISYMARTGSALCTAVMTPVEGEGRLPSSKEELIAGIRSVLSEKQGLIQAEVLDNRAFSILKELKESGGVQYLVAYQRVYPEFVLNIQARFEEIGLTGWRDTLVYGLCRQQKLVGGGDDPYKGWVKDPYDETLRTGFLMNLSELEQFDKQFPESPLARCREFVRAID